MSTGQPTQFDKKVFQATREIFVGDKAKTRKCKSVKRYIREYSGDKSSLKQLRTQYGEGIVQDSILRLLSHGLYESTLVAIQWFPDLLEVAGTQNEVVPQPEIAKTTGQLTPEDLPQTSGDECLDQSKSTEATTPIDGGNESIARNGNGRSPAIPVYLPFTVEHMLMEKIQKTLELACYQYGLKFLPNLMQKQGWDCPEAVELTKWTKLFARKGNLVWEGSGQPSKQLLQSIATIRHAAVHRLRINSVGLERFLTNAENLAEVLGNDQFIQTISQLRLHTQETRNELIQHKETIQTQLEIGQEEIARHRAELNRKEQEILRHAESEDRKYRHIAGEKLERTLGLMGDLSVSSNGQGESLESVDDIEDDPISDDYSDSDHDEQFEDCSEV
ncbi:hypothetical protein FLONG3_449 [Fusarium longipes]|uniref:Ubiquinol-cytochrome-c reductase cytochrome c1 n=1 Tax=Fusarium longipes TaxID=694270 RepID=A0A395TAQ1_9HYPO|nr:hypothetical protein FLONG3_449 [Fusarium longipes]